MLARALLLSPLVAVPLLACSSSSSPSSSADGGAGGANLVTASFSMQATVAGGGEMFKCQLVTLPDVQGFLVEGDHHYTPGSHHLLFYTTDLTTIPAGQGGVEDCYEGTGNDLMSHVRGVLYAGQTPTGGEQLPAGVGLATTPSQVLLFQVHYLNAGSSALDAQVHVDLTIDTGNDIAQRAGVFFFYDPFIDVPAGAKAKAQMRCPVPDDVTLIFASSHYHSRGVGYGAYVDTSATDLATAPFYTSDNWSSPPNQQMTMSVKGGSRIRFECDYDNTNGTQEYFQGQSAQKNEMCMFIGVYYPDMGLFPDYCLSSPDMFGTGVAACGATESCLLACGKVGIGKLSAFSGGSDCEQKCVVASCQSAWTPLDAVFSCMQSQCSTPCADTTSAACTSCLQTQCASEGAACGKHTCE